MLAVRALRSSVVSVPMDLQVWLAMSVRFSHQLPEYSCRVSVAEEPLTATVRPGFAVAATLNFETSL